MAGTAAADIRSELLAAVARDQVHAAYVIDGGPGTPKRELAEWFARRLLCRQPGDDPCGVCHDCRLLAAGDGDGPITHPDLRIVEPDGTVVKVDQIRVLQRELSLRSNEGGRRVAILFGAETLRAAAANALLKTLEEPPPDCVLILVAEGAEALPPTVRSRTVRLRLAPALESEIRSALESEGLDADDAWLASTVAGGSTGSAREWAAANLDEAREMRDFLAGIARVGASEILDFAESFRGSGGRDRAQLLLAVHAAFARRAAVDALENEPETVAMWVRQYEENDRARGEMQMRNLNPLLVIEGLLLDLRAAL